MQKRVSVSIPADADGFLERECHHCHTIFAIDSDEHEKRAHINLRCPNCQFIERADEYTTTNQRRYAHAAARNELNKIAADFVNDAVDNMFSGIKNTEFLTIERGDDGVDFGADEIPSPHSGRELSEERCGACGFRFKVADASRRACPVCR